MRAASLDADSSPNGGTEGALDATLVAMLTSLRHTLHACPERAGEEVRTAAVVTHFLSAYAPDALLTGVGGHGVLATFASPLPGPTVLVRCDLDAVRVERNEHNIGAANDLMRHVCGHDGHMTIVAGLAPLLHRLRPPRGRVALLFQPAEETGEGAARVLEDARFRQLDPEMVFGFHNLPGFPIGTIVLANEIFASASVGMYARFVGQASHAAQPELARSPRLTVSRLLEALPALSSPSNETAARARSDYRLLTVTHARLGRESFGVTPGLAELLATLRATTRVTLGQFRGEVESLVRSEAASANHDVRIDWQEEFPETRSDVALSSLFADVAHGARFPVHHLPAPMPWSDDFGQFGSEYPSLYFGLGIGESASGLHQPDYAFPDEVIPVGTALLDRMCRRALT
jgi:amidohydrolase